MIYLLAALSLLALGATAALLYLKGDKAKTETEKPILPDAECCGQHEVCERESLLSAVSKEVEYYDDEALDRFRGRAPEDYTEQETEEFQDVLYTMKEEEVAGWARSLQLRGIQMPEEVREEVILIVEERRQNAQSHHQA